MICPECQTDNIEGVDHCENCGHDLRGLDQPDAPGARTGVEFMYQRLSELPAKAPSRVQADDPVGFSVRLMQSEETGCVLVMSGDDLAGIITPWDILHKVAGPDEDLNAVTCGQVMTADPVFLRDEDTIAVALNKMSIGGFRHIPLLQDGRPKAVVNIEDVFAHISPYLS
jgi:CBS domain-containing protein